MVCREAESAGIAHCDFYAGIAVSGSMIPMIYPGRDILIIRPVSWMHADGRLRRWDIALYRDGSHLILHRVIKVLREGYLLSGDSNGCVERVRDEQIIGILTWVIRDGKKIDIYALRYRIYAFLWGGRPFVRNIAGKVRMWLNGDEKKHERQRKAGQWV